MHKGALGSCVFSNNFLSRRFVSSLRPPKRSGKNYFLFLFLFYHSSSHVVKQFDNIFARERKSVKRLDKPWRSCYNNPNKRINAVHRNRGVCSLSGILQDGMLGDKEITVRIRSNSHYRISFFSGRKSSRNAYRSATRKGLLGNRGRLW